MNLLHYHTSLFAFAVVGAGSEAHYIQRSARLRVIPSSQSDSYFRSLYDPDSTPAQTTMAARLVSKGLNGASAAASFGFSVAKAGTSFGVCAWLPHEA